MTDTRQVVVVGGGFAGIGCARKLAKRPDIHVTLIDKHNYHQFQPLLYQVATSQLSSANVAANLRKLFHGHANVDVKMDEVTEVDPVAKQWRSHRDGVSRPTSSCLLLGASPTSFTRQALSTPSRCTRWRMPSGCGPGSWRFSRTPTVTLPSSIAAR